MLEKLTDNRTRLTLDQYIAKGLVSRLAFALVRKKEPGEITDQSVIEET